jgi:hypothetical protein
LSSSTSAAAAAFWELDIPNSNNQNANIGSNPSFSMNQKSSNYLTTWLQTQITAAVTKTVLKLPFNTATATTTTSTDPSTATSNNISEQQRQNEQQPHIQMTTRVFYHNLITAVQALRVVTDTTTKPSSEDGNEDNPNNIDKNNDDDDDDDDDIHTGNTTQRPGQKRRKPSSSSSSSTLGANKNTKRPRRQYLQDPYHIWFQTTSNHDNHDSIPNHNTPRTLVVWDEEQDDMPTVVGGKLAILSVGGLFNALSASYVCTTPILPHSSKLLLQQMVQNGTIQQWKQQQQLHQIPYVTIGHLYHIATTLHVAIAEQVKYDIVRTTPLRIQLLLASDLSPSEFQSVRRRLHDTVILGKGVQQQQQQSNAASMNNDDGNQDTTLAVGATTQPHAIEKYKKCPGCGNNDQSEFVLDRKNGDLICANCGIVVSESIMHEGSQFRKFEGEVDRNHHGDTINPLYSNAHNMSTSLSTVMPTTGAGMGGRGSGMGGGRRNLETILKNAHAYTELNVSQFGRTDARRTRVGYKDRQKKSAFAQMTHAGDALNLHEAVVQRAKELFAGKAVSCIFVYFYFCYHCTGTKEAQRISNPRMFVGNHTTFSYTIRHCSSVRFSR